MAKSKRVLVKTDHGYLGRKGKSKYWGVTTRQLGNGKDGWVVSFKANDLDQTVTLTPEWVRVTENDMARVAAYIYEVGQTFKDLGSEFILAESGKHVMWINRVNRRIYRKVLTTECIYKHDENPITLPETTQTPVVTEPVAAVIEPVQHTPEVKSASTDPFVLLVRLLPSMELRADQCQALIELLKCKAATAK